MGKRKNSYKTIFDIERYISTRSFNRLKKAGLINIEDIAKLTLSDLLKIPGMGKKSAIEMFNICEELGYKPVRTETNPWFGAISERMMAYSKFVLIKDMYLSVRAHNSLDAAGIITLFDLLKYDDVYKIRNFGKTTRDLLVERISELSEELDNVNFKKTDLDSNLLKNTIDMFDGYFVTAYKDSPKKLLKDAYSNFVDNLDIYLKFNDETDFNTYKFFLSIKNGTKSFLNEKIKKTFESSNFGDRSIDIFISRGKGITLESLGQKYKIQRERIRQIDVKNVEIVKNIFINEGINNLLNSALLIDPSINFTQLTDLYYSIFTLRLDEIAEYAKIQFNGKILFCKKDYYDYLNSQFKKVLENIQSNGLVSATFIDEITRDPLVISYFFNKYKIKKYDSRVGLKMTLRKQMEIFINEREVIDISKSMIKSTISDFSKEFDSKVLTERAITAIVEKAGYSIGNGKFVSKKNKVEIPEKVLSDICKEIREKKFINASTLYSKYGSQIKNVYSPTRLYLYLKENFKNNFDFGGTNLYIAEKGGVTSISGRTYSFLKQSDKPVDRDILMLKMGLTTIAINIIDSQNDDIFKFGIDRYYLKSKLSIDEVSYKEISEYLNSFTEFNIKDLYTYVLSKNLPILKSNYINDIYSFRSYCINLPSDLFNEYVFDRASNRCKRKRIKTGDFDENYNFEL